MSMIISLMVAPADQSIHMCVCVRAKFESIDLPSKQDKYYWAYGPIKLLMLGEKIGTGTLRLEPINNSHVAAIGFG